ncbi:TlpA disulfide reductase family protein [Luteimicrobium xylanilyticum]|uniref:TlpA family protein disulfide reductase n=1 Tax=Luteimicrobium xylanilyticum TaxID=1133546 RepID=UPI0004B7C725|nr:TlpA disulfide reductase family protein [Luteimicrobium xylanilyticum]
MPRPRPARLAALAAVLVAGALALTGCTSSSGNGGGNLGFVQGDGSVKTWTPSERSKPVTLTGTAFDGTKVDTSAWRGDVVVVNTWYAGCAPCRKEAPDLASLASSEKDGVHFVGINSTDDAGAAEAFQRTFKITYPSISDKSGSVVATLQGVVPVQAVPTTVVLDADGRVAARVLGATTKTTLADLISDVRASDGTATAAPTS